MTILKNSWFWVVAVTAGILAVPLITMQFSDEVNWDFTDFIVAGILLLVMGSLINLTRITVEAKKYKTLLIVVLVLLLLLIWAELAVGIFGTPFSGN